MKINNVTNQNFKGNIFDKTARFISERPEIVAGLAGSTVVAQKIVMSGSEAVVGPMMDIGIGKAITKITNEKDGRTNESSKVQAIRTFSQSVGGTIVGVITRLACIGLATAAFAKLGAKAGGKIAKIINEDNLSPDVNKFLYQDNAEKWGKNFGGAIATIVMLGTNFIIDAPFINWINKKATDVVDNFSNKNNKKEVK